MQTPFPLEFNDSIYHEGNISKIPDFDVLTLLESRKRKSRSHGIRKRGNDKLKRCAAIKLNTSLYDLAAKLREHGRHSMLSHLSSLPIAVLRSLDKEANRFYDRNHQMYDAALLTRCLRPFVDSESNHRRHFIKIPFINKGNDFIDLPSIFQDKSVSQSILPKLGTSYYLLQIRKTNQSEILFSISINLFLIWIVMLILLSLESVKIQNIFINPPDI